MELKAKSIFRNGSLAAVALIALFSFSAFGLQDRQLGIPSTERPEILQGVGISEKLGQTLDLSTEVVDENGSVRPLSSFITNGNPMILSPVYYSCPGLCNFHLNGLIDGLKGLSSDWSVGKKFDIVALSFDAKETPELAMKKKESYMKMYGVPASEAHWHFVTASQASIDKITQGVGFGFRWNEAAQEWAHASAAIVIANDGKISRYLPGISFQAQDIKFAVLEASEGKVGSFVEQLVLYCFKYDTHKSKYAIYAVNIMKMGGGLTVALLAIWLLPVWIRNRNMLKTLAGR